jgi:hypothetical protein
VSSLKSDSFGLKWAKFFLLRDTIGKALLALTAVLVASWVMFAKDNTTFALVAGASLVFTVLFSLIHYVTVGKYKENAEYKFYDAIYNDCDFSPPYKKRDMRPLKVEWKRLRVSKIAINASSNSSVAKSAKEWRTIKLSVEDSFKLAGNNIVAILDNHSAGRIVFVAGTDEQFAPGGEYSSVWFKEGLYAFTYEMLAHYGDPLPRLTVFELDEDGKRQPRLKRVQVEITNTPSSYQKKDYESHFRQRYDSPEHIWTFDWNPSGVTIESVERGSQKDRTIQATKSVADLISSSVSTAFHFYNSRGYLFKPNMVEWSSGGRIATIINIDFLQSDISRPDQIDRFEELMSQGLIQLFRGVQYEYDWNVDAFEKSLTIRVI